MKKLFITMIFISVALFAKAQTAGDIRLQIGGDYGFEMERFGVNLGGEYLITDDISAAPSFTFFFPENNLNASNLNIDLRYYLTHDHLQFYGMAGYTLLRFSSEYMGIKASYSNSGANIGIGTVAKLSSNFAINPEVKYQTVGDGQVAVKVGLVYLIQ